MRRSRVHKFIRCLLAWPAVFAVLLCAAAAAVRAEDARPKQEVKFEVQPSDIILDAATAPVGRLRVIAHNSSGTEVTGKLNFIAPPGLVAKELEAPSFPASGDLSWLVEVTAAESLPSPAKLVIEFAHIFGTASAPTIATAVATITLPAPQSPAASIKASLAPAEGNVDEFRPLDLRLQIDNPTRRTVEIGQMITALTPSPTYIDLKAGAHATTILPGGSIGVPLRVTAKAAIPGTYALMVGFDVRFLNPQGAWEPTTAQSKVTIGIPGITDALQFLGIPSLLLLPGVLMILTFLTVLPWLTGLPEVDWKKPALLLLAVLLSFAAAYVYPPVTQRWIGLARDYLRGYELRDVVYVWAGSMAAGLIAVGVTTAVYWVAVAIHRRTTRSNNPQAGDQPIDILRKLRRHGAAFKLRAREPTTGTRTQWKLALPFGGTAERQWLVQQGLIGLTDAGRAANRGAAIQGCLEDIDKATPGAIDGLIDKIETGLSKQELTLKWDRDIGPEEVNTAAYSDADGGLRLIVRYEP